jgi:hypothetical protein
MFETIADITGCAIPLCEDASPVEQLLHGVRSFSRAAGMPVNVDASVITERAAMLGLPPPGQTSANGTCRMIRARDGWIAVNLPRESDLELLPAWLDAGADDAWPTIEKAARTRDCHDLVTTGQLLGLAVAQVAEHYAPPPLITRHHQSRSRKKKPLVLDLSNLWAGPLCGALLAEAGCDVVKVESPARPDGARSGNPEFFARLNGKKRPLSLDMPRERDRLMELLATADIVIESARPRVLENWGMTLGGIFDANPLLTWISVTGYGRSGERANWVGFGDDVAAAAGLIAVDADGPHFVGDAIADPLAGLTATASAFACLAAGGGFLIDTSLFAAAAFVAAVSSSSAAA